MLAIEGRVNAELNGRRIPYRGANLADVMGGIRSGLTYCGATDIKGLQRKAQFMEISGASLVEGMPHLARWGNELAARPAIQRATKL